MAAAKKPWSFAGSVASCPHTKSGAIGGRNLFGYCGQPGGIGIPLVAGSDGSRRPWCCRHNKAPHGKPLRPGNCCHSVRSWYQKAYAYWKPCTGGGLPGFAHTQVMGAHGHHFFIHKTGRRIIRHQPGIAHHNGVGQVIGRHQAQGKLPVFPPASRAAGHKKNCPRPICGAAGWRYCLPGGRAGLCCCR